MWIVRGERLRGSDQNADPVGLRRRLRLGGERRGEETERVHPK